MPLRPSLPFCLIATSLAATALPLAATAQQGGPQFSFGLTTYADAAIEGDADDDGRYSWRADIKMSYGEIWDGGSVSAHLEYNDGDDFVGFGEGGVIWPTNVFAALPRATANENTTLSLTVTQQFSPSTNLTFGKFNVIDLAEQTPLIGGQGQGGFQYTGLAAPGNFVLPPYVFGGMLAVKTDPMIFSFFVYDPNNAQGEDFWDNLFDDGAVYNGTVTFATALNGQPGFYNLNLVHSTKKGTDYESLLLSPDDDSFAGSKQGVSYAGISFQQYLWSNPQNPMQGWGVFGQVGFGDGNPNPLDALYLVGVGGNAPFAGRESDRWGLAWSRYDWSDKLGEALDAYGVNLQDEWAVEAFYEAALNENWRLGGNIMRVQPSFESFDDYTQIGFRLRATF
ncbi:hypothetical protein AYJ57_21975 (plasmid) [Salipiger sp. CCB-MM3]|uniref:carbohydrate porin n=1 Tax=Salipiger sp. CCB-MM3 TaxID=1792508 RepID=UPI00080A99F5|nr:carbohydrate porin [Salipiger sp. CCB-MM3]ANT63154.1 hypothetical protein AYJ57_21975 [Salipiger sp. CCB-MM3]